MITLTVVLIATAAALLLFAAFALAAAHRLCNLALRRGSDRTKALHAPHNRINMPDEQAAQKLEAQRQEWLASVREEEVLIASEDGLNLHGLIYTPADGGKSPRWAILCHGYTSQAAHMQTHARHISRMGFNILLPDARGHGKSEGTYIGMGWHDRRDIVAWTKHILSRAPDARILLFGISMGAAAVMMAAGEADLPASVRAVVEDCGYSSVWEEFAYQVKKLFGLPRFPVLHIASRIAQRRYGWNFREASAVEQLKKSRLPILCVHGSKDTFVPVRMIEQVYVAACGFKRKLIVEGAGHGAAAAVGGESYWQTLREFAFLYID